MILSWLSWRCVSWSSISFWLHYAVFLSCDVTAFVVTGLFVCVKGLRPCLMVSDCLPGFVFRIFLLCCFWYDDSDLNSLVFVLKFCGMMRFFLGLVMRHMYICCFSTCRVTVISCFVQPFVRSICLQVSCGFVACEPLSNRSVASVTSLFCLRIGLMNLMPQGFVILGLILLCLSSSGMMVLDSFKSCVTSDVIVCP